MTGSMARIWRERGGSRSSWIICPSQTIRWLTRSGWRAAEGRAGAHANGGTVVADAAGAARQALVGGAAARYLPLELEVAGGDDRWDDQGRPLAHCPVGDADPVGRGGVVDVNGH